MKNIKCLFIFLVLIFSFGCKKFDDCIDNFKCKKNNFFGAKEVFEIDGKINEINFNFKKYQEEKLYVDNWQKNLNKKELEYNFIDSVESYISDEAYFDKIKNFYKFEEKGVLRYFKEYVYSLSSVGGSFVKIKGINKKVDRSEFYKKRKIINFYKNFSCYISIEYLKNIFDITCEKVNDSNFYVKFIKSKVINMYDGSYVVIPGLKKFPNGILNVDELKCAHNFFIVLFYILIACAKDPDIDIFNISQYLCDFFYYKNVPFLVVKEDFFNFEKLYSENENIRIFLSQKPKSFLSFVVEMWEHIQFLCNVNVVQQKLVNSSVFFLKNILGEKCYKTIYLRGIDDLQKINEKNNCENGIKKEQIKKLKEILFENKKKFRFETLKEKKKINIEAIKKNKVNKGETKNKKKDIKNKNDGGSKEYIKEFLLKKEIEIIKHLANIDSSYEYKIKKLFGIPFIIMPKYGDNIYDFLILKDDEKYSFYKKQLFLLIKKDIIDKQLKNLLEKGYYYENLNLKNIVLEKNIGSCLVSKIKLKLIDYSSFKNIDDVKFLNNNKNNEINNNEININKNRINDEKMGNDFLSPNYYFYLYHHSLLMMAKEIFFGTTNNKEIEEKINEAIDYFKKETNEEIINCWDGYADIKKSREGFFEKYKKLLGTLSDNWNEEYNKNEEDNKNEEEAIGEEKKKKKIIKNVEVEVGKCKEDLLVFFKEAFSDLDFFSDRSDVKFFCALYLLIKMEENLIIDNHIKIEIIDIFCEHMKKKNILIQIQGENQFLYVV